MKKRMFGLATFAVAMTVASSAMALVPKPAAVPEISALEGMAAVAALAAVVLLVWERRRRAS